MFNIQIQIHSLGACINQIKNRLWKRLRKSQLIELEARERLLEDEREAEMARLKPHLEALEVAEATDGICRDAQSDAILYNSAIPAIDDELSEIRYALYYRP